MAPGRYSAWRTSTCSLQLSPAAGAPSAAGFTSGCATGCPSGMCAPLGGSIAPGRRETIGTEAGRWGSPAPSEEHFACLTSASGEADSLPRNGAPEAVHQGVHRGQRPCGSHCRHLRRPRDAAAHHAGGLDGQRRGPGRSGACPCAWATQVGRLWPLLDAHRLLLSGFHGPHVRGAQCCEAHARPPGFVAGQHQRRWPFLC